MTSEGTFMMSTARVSAARADTLSQKCLVVSPFWHLLVNIGIFGSCFKRTQATDTWHATRSPVASSIDRQHAPRRGFQQLQLPARRCIA